MNFCFPHRRHLSLAEMSSANRSAALLTGPRRGHPQPADQEIGAPLPCAVLKPGRRFLTWSAGFQPARSDTENSMPTRRQDAGAPRSMSPMSIPFWRSKLSMNIYRGRENFVRPLLALLVGLLLLAAPGVLKAAQPPMTNAVTGDITTPASGTNSPSAATNAFNVLDDKYHLSIGDQLSFQILEDEDPPVQLVVSDSGNIQVPYIGLYPAVGRTCKQLAQALKVELEKEYYYQATVVVSVVSKPRSRGKIY